LLRSKRATVSVFMSRCGKLTAPGIWPAMYASRERASITTMSARAALRSTDKSHESVWNRSLPSIIVAVSAGSGAPNSRTADISFAIIDQSTSIPDRIASCSRRKVLRVAYLVTSATRSLCWQPAKHSRKSPLHARALAPTMSAPRFPGTSGRAASRSAMGNSTPYSQRGRSNRPRSDTGIKECRSTPSSRLEVPQKGAAAASPGHSLSNGIDLS
jgi:hypothetical protein